MKDLSKQLCELAGIEAKEVEDLTCEGLEDVCEDCFSSYKCVSPCCCDNPKLEDKVREILSRNKKLVYPNFESPENFVKLLECLFQFPFGCEEKETYVKSILCGTIEKLKNEDCQELKQALQQTEFEY